MDLISIHDKAALCNALRQLWIYLYGVKVVSRFCLPFLEKRQGFFRTNLWKICKPYSICKSLDRQWKTACPLGNLFFQFIDFRHLASTDFGLEIF